MAAKHVFGNVDLTREEREADRRIREATKDRPSLEELERRLGPGEPVADLDAAFARSAIAHQIGVAREKAGITSAQLAEMIGSDQAAVSRIESGGRNTAPDAPDTPDTLDTLIKLAKVLGLRVTVEPVGKE